MDEKMQQSLGMLSVAMTMAAEGLLEPSWEHATQGPYHCFNSGGVECEVGEFLYSLVRMLKPRHILETGTHLGISSSYMACALVDNGIPGILTTWEFDQGNHEHAKRLWQVLDVAERVDGRLGASMTELPAPNFYDLMLLDTEPHIRFDEFVYYWASLKPGGFVLIHDLHPHLGHTDQTVNGMYDWPYGDFRPKLGEFIKSHEVQTVTFPSPRGCTMFQKAADNFSHTKLLKGTI